MASYNYIFLSLLLLFVVFVRSLSVDYGYFEKDLATEESVHNLFEKWCVVHNKVYGSNSEKMLRYGIFKNKLERIHTHNKQQPPPSYMLGLNEFSDISNSKLNAGMPVMKYEKSSERSSVKDLIGGDPVPTSIDWRERGAVSSVKNAGSCRGGSWAFATAGAIEGANQIATGQLVDLSAQQLIDCETKYGNKGCESGFPQYAFFYLAASSTGIYTDADYPFVGTNTTCTKKNGFVVSIDGYDNLWSSSDDSDIVKAVAIRPVTALVDGKSDAFQNYKSGIFSGPCDDRKVSTSVLIVGYGSENGKDYWILKNSWGTSWGENGYMRLQRGNHGLPLGRCAINSFVWYPTEAPSSNVQNLVGWWKLDDSGSVAKDSSVSRADGNISGAYWEQGGGLTFNGSGVVSCGTKASLCGKTPFSVVAWVKIPSDVDTKAIIVQQRGPNDYNGEYQLYIETGGRPSFWVYGDYADQFWFTASVSVNDGKWHNIVAVRDGREGRLYVDGSLKASATGDVKNLLSGLPVCIGCDCRDVKKFFKGSIAGVRVYSRALSVNEIKVLSSGAPTGLLLSDI